MSLIGKVGRRRPRARFALFLIYLVLVLGAVTTIYPFLVMISTGFKGPTDQNDDRTIPRYWSVVEAKDEKGKLMPESLYGKYLADKYAGDNSMIASTRLGVDASNLTIQHYETFLMKVPVEYYTAGFRLAPAQITGRLATLYQEWLRARYSTIDDLNKAYIDENTAFQTVAPPNELLERKGWQPPQERKYREWLLFKSQLPAEFRIPIREQRLYQEFLRSKFKNQFSEVPASVAVGAKAFEQIPLVRKGDLYTEFVAKALPDRYKKGSVEDLWRNQATSEVMPIDAYERQWVHGHAGELRSEFAGRNYRYVIDYIALNGRALWNTVFFCFLAILTQLTVNPLAAYALSRYPIRASGKILLFLLATMAFPAEVAMIPSFLLLKQMHLLNTFSALVLPGVASGYMIFLLKGFFDSLPSELYEAGMIDGARESTMMFKITLPLSKPVLGYIALLAFMSAYGSFMYAFLVAQDQKIWTLMVWIYSLQSYAPKSVIMAALVIAALPTLIVFLFAQRVIMRGIILPNER